MQETFCACMLGCISHVCPFATLWTIAHQAPVSLGLSRQEYWSGLPCPPPGDPPNPGVKPVSAALQADSLPTEPHGKPRRHSTLYGAQNSYGERQKTKAYPILTLKTKTIQKNLLSILIFCFEIFIINSWEFSKKCTQMYVPFTQFPPIVIPCTVQYQNQAADTGIIHSILNFHLHVCVCESTTHTGAFSQHYNQHAELPHHYKAPSCIATSFPFLQLLILAITSLFSISKILSFQGCYIESYSM